MKTFTTSIFVPGWNKDKMNLQEAMILSHRLNSPVTLPETQHGSMDDIEEGEEFILIVNGETYKHEIKMKGARKVAGKLRLLFAEPEKEEVKRFAQWRIKGTFLNTLNNGQHYQLKNFTVHDLRRLIRHAVGNREKQLVQYK